MAFTSKTSSIIYKEDIIREMSKEMGIPEEELFEIVDLNLKYIKKSVLEGDHLLINFPNLCKLRLNYKLALDSATNGSPGNKRKISLKKKISILAEKKLKKTRYPLLSFKNPLYERLWRKAKRIKYNKNPYKNMHNMIKELEEETNLIIEKIT